MLDSDHADAERGRGTTLGAVAVLGFIALLGVSAERQEAEDLPTHRSRLVGAIEASFRQSAVTDICDELDRVTKAMKQGQLRDKSPIVPAPCTIPRPSSRRIM